MKKAVSWIEQADQAILRAAVRAREIAERTNTSLHVLRDGKIVTLTPSLRHGEKSAPRS